MTRRAQDLILVVLALLAAVTTYLAFANVRGAAPTGDEVANGGLTPGAGSPTTQDEGDGVDNTAGPTESPDSSGVGAPLAAARDALASDDPVTIAVLGDSTSNERSEWVHLWAAMLAEDRPVTISHWNESDGTTYNGPDILSEDGEGSEVTIWSGSIAGATAASTAELLPGIVPERPDFVIYNYGHNSPVDEVADHFDTLHAGIEDRYGDVPTIVILQNPQLDDRAADVREAVEAWARANGADVIDVAADWPQAAWPWLVDEVHPSQQGQQFWAETVADALR